MTTQPESEDYSFKPILDQLRSILIDGETLEAWSIQRRIFSLTHRRVVIAATSGRFIALSRCLLSGFDMVDFRWQDLKDTKLRVGILGADITLSFSSMSDLAGGESVARSVTYKGFLKDQTQQVYRLCQSHEQAWREKRRVRELEEMRAQSGGIQLANPAGAPSFSGSTAEDGTSAVARLQQAKQMLDAKLISDSEYEQIKARIIGSV